jgi:hypothetical protein
VLADDVCAITFDAGGRPIAHPGIPRLLYGARRSKRAVGRLPIMKCRSTIWTSIMCPPG